MALPRRFSPTLIRLLALGVLSASALACAPPPDSVTSSGGVTSSPPGDPMATPISDEFPEDWYGANIDDVLTPAVRDRILQNVAADLNRPVSSLRLAAAETAIWDGCLGIYVPETACTEIAIFGLRVVVTDGDQSWVYHTHYGNEGHGVVQNPTASGSRNGLIPDFIPKPTAPTDPAEDHLFRSVESGSLGGAVKETLLLTDGRLIQRDNGRVVAEDQLSSDQVAAFQQVLEDQRFPNLHRMRYFTEAALADYPTVRLSSWSVEVEYIDLALGDAPVALQAMVAAWDALVTEADR